MASGRHGGGELCWVWLSSFLLGALEPASEIDARGLPGTSITAELSAVIEQARDRVVSRIETTRSRATLKSSSVTAETGKERTRP